MKHEEARTEDGVTVVGDDAKRINDEIIGRLNGRWNGGQLSNAEANAAGKVSDLRYSDFLSETYKPDPDHPMTRIIIGDKSVTVIGHSPNQAACVAVTAAVQTFAAITQKLGLATKVDLDESGREPIYQVQLISGKETKAAISGLMFSFAGISRQCPGSLLLHDSRKR